MALVIVRTLRGFCPQHEWDWPLCGEACNRDRLALRKASAALRTYFSEWQHDRLAKPVMRRVMCEWCHVRFITKVHNRRFCTRSCRERKRYARALSREARAA